MLKINYKIAGLLFCVSLTLWACQNGDTPQAAETGQHIYLVRHAEKILNVDDPALTPDGQSRALALAERLEDVDVTGIYSSDYKRTRDTAAPLAAAKGLAVQTYDPRDLPGLAARLKTECNICVVVGHSNTTPELADALGGDFGGEIDEATEYDRLYHIVIKQKDGESGEIVTTKIERYGAP